METTEGEGEGERGAGLTAIDIAKGVNVGAPATKVCTRLILNVNLHRICMRHRAYPRLTRSTPGLNTSLIAVYTCAVYTRRYGGSPFPAGHV